jgi:hypothetical protein
MDTTKVIFRRYKDAGDIIAIFPEELATMNPNDCSSYEYFGQHSSCDPFYVIQKTYPAKEADYQSLQKELEGIGYKLEIVQRLSRKFYQTRKTKLENTCTQ